MRQASIERRTAETEIALQLTLEGSGHCEVETDCGFLKHMLELFAHHGRFDLVMRCRKVGVGKPISDKVGGWCSTLYPPVAFEGTVKALYDGEMSLSRGNWSNMGPSAAIRVRNTILIVTTRHHANGSLGLYRCFGYDPVNFEMVVVKACTSFRANYEPLTDLIYPAATKGPASSDLLSFPFTHVSKEFYPFTDDCHFVPQVNAWGKQNF